MVRTFFLLCLGFIVVSGMPRFNSGGRGGAGPPRGGGGRNPGMDMAAAMAFSGNDNMWPFLLFGGGGGGGAGGGSGFGSIAPYLFYSFFN